MSVKARMVVQVVEKRAGQEKVTLSPVYSSDPASPNYSYSQATPAGSLELWITNPGAHGFFEPGSSYDVIIHPAEPVAG